MQTNSRDSARYFGGNDHTFQWLRLTHEPSPWIGDWCWLLFGLVFPPHPRTTALNWRARSDWRAQSEGRGAARRQPRRAAFDARRAVPLTRGALSAGRRWET